MSKKSIKKRLADIVGASDKWYFDRESFTLQDYTDPPVSVKDTVNSPSHYNVGNIETIDYIEAKQLGYHLGNVVKYVSRAGHKGERLEDLKKARWYLNREIDNLEITNGNF